jgi:hypothetical protein
MADWFETRFPQDSEPARVDPAFAARIRTLVLDEWRADPARGAGANEILSDRDRYQGEIVMLDTEDPITDEEPLPPQRRLPGRWLLVAAAVAVVAVAGALLVGGNDEVDTATQKSAPEPAKEVPVDDGVPLQPGRWFVDPDGDASTPLRVSFEVSAGGWESWLGTVKFGGGGHAMLTVAAIDNLVREACTGHSPADPAVGPTVDDLAIALSQLAPFEVTSPPTDVTVRGYRGTHVQLTVPDIPIVNARGGRNFEGCQGGQLQSWFSPIHDGGSAAFFGYNAEPGRTEDYWILDVDGTRLVLITMSSPASPAADVDELEAIFDSIRIEP